MQEFIEFQSRLENSLQKMIADRELIRLELLKEDSVSRTITYLKELELGNLKYDGKTIFLTGTSIQGLYSTTKKKKKARLNSLVSYSRQVLRIKDRQP